MVQLHSCGLRILIASLAIWQERRCLFSGWSTMLLKCLSRAVETCMFSRCSGVQRILITFCIIHTRMHLPFDRASLQVHSRPGSPVHMPAWSLHFREAGRTQSRMRSGHAGGNRVCGWRQLNIIILHAHTGTVLTGTELLYVRQVSACF